MAALTKVIPVYQPALGAIGTGLQALTKVDPSLSAERPIRSKRPILCSTRLGDHGKSTENGHFKL